jgi:hypothetical protein
MMSPGKDCVRSLLDTVDVAADDYATIDQDRARWYRRRSDLRVGLAPTQLSRPANLILDVVALAQLRNHREKL